MSVIGSNVLAGASGGAVAGYEIARSLRFNDTDTAFLSRTPSSASSGNTKLTYSVWVKGANAADKTPILSASSAGGSESIEHRNDGTLVVFFDEYVDGAYTTSAVFRDPSAWYHYVFSIDTTLATAADRVKIYVNGVQVSTTASPALTQNFSFTGFNQQSKVQYIGRTANTSGGVHHYASAMYADIHMIDGQALAATDFGEYDDNNVWQPIEYAGTYGTNGFHLDFSDNTSTTTIAEDSSGNNNDFTANNLSVASGAGNDSLIDTPTNYEAASGNNGGNYCTWNPLHTDTSNNFNPTLSNGNLDCSWRITDWNVALGTLRVSSGKWYWEITLTAGSRCMIGVTKYNTFNSSNAFYYSSDAYAYFSSTGDKRNGGASGSSYGATFAQGDVIGVALDLDAGTLVFYKNGTSQGTAFTGLSGNFTPLWGSDLTGNTGSANFGQRPFAYTPPTGHLSLCTQNLPDPTIADGSTAFDAKLWTGNATDNRDITGYGFSPDLVWIKERGSTGDHHLFDIVRGANKALRSNEPDAEVTTSDELKAFNSDGFRLGTGGDVNASGTATVGWAWDGGTSTVSNTDGSIASSVRANASAGFSIVTGTQDANNTLNTFGHGLNAEPHMVILKRRNGAEDWYVYLKVLGNTSRIQLNSTSAVTTGSGVWGSTTPTSSVFTIQSFNAGDFVAYCFAPVEGYSAFGSYTGNGSADGPFVYTGFRPAWIMYKRTDSSTSAHWVIVDSQRDPFNLAGKTLGANLSDAEATSDCIDILSNGFKLRSSGTVHNASGGTYIVAAFSEHPFKAARAR